MAQFRQTIAKAGVLRKLDRNDEAIKFYQRGLAERKEASWLEDRDTLTSMHDLATVFKEQRRLEDAEKLAEQVLAGRKKVLGPRHGDTNASARILAEVRQQMESQKKKVQKEDKQNQKKPESAQSPSEGKPKVTISALGKEQQEQGQHMKTKSLASPEQNQQKEPGVTESPVPSEQILPERDQNKVTEVTPSPARGSPSRKPPKPTILWLKDEDMLPGKIRNARIMQFSYPSTIEDLEGSKETTLGSIAKALHDNLQERGRLVKPVVFIGHGFGGIVVEKTLVMKPLIPTAGILFLGTPIWGSTAGTMLAKYAGDATTKLLLEKLGTNKFQDDLLGSLLPKFNKIVKDREILLESYSNQQVMFEKLYGESHPFTKVCVALTEFGG